MVRAFLADLHRYADRPVTRSKLAGVFFTNYGAQATFAFRLGKSLRWASRKWWLIPMALVGWAIYVPLRAYARHALGIRLDLSSEIGPGFRISHFGGIHLSGCKLGSHCTVGHFSHILPGPDGPGPVIGDRVWIGSHARIIGPYSIGSGGTVSAAAVVCRNIPEKAMCLGNPARIVAHPYDNRSLLRLS
jgi:serine O-acetyltransferase